MGKTKHTIMKIFAFTVCLLSAVTFAAPNQKLNKAIDNVDNELENFAPKNGISLDQAKAEAEQLGVSMLDLVKSKYPNRFNQAENLQAKIETLINAEKDSSVKQELRDAKKTGAKLCNDLPADFRSLCKQAVNAAAKKANQNIPQKAQRQSLEAIFNRVINKAVDTYNQEN